MRDRQRETERRERGRDRQTDRQRNLSFYRDEERLRHDNFEEMKDRKYRIIERERARKI
jgi:hypothetical protein